MKNPLVAAYRYTTNNWSQVLASKVCGCCNCVQTFAPDDVVGWTGLDMHNADDPKAIEGQTERFDAFARLPHHPFPGGRALRVPFTALGAWYYGLRDALGV